MQNSNYLRALAFHALLLTTAMTQAAAPLQWEQLPPIPDPEGFAGAFAGVSGGALLVAGGANLTGDKWADPIQKKWYDSVFVLERPDGAWRLAGKLPTPLGYGLSITTDGGLLCLGGSDLQRHHAEVFLLQYTGGELTTAQTSYPPLPLPLANACGALLGRTIYVAGGLDSPTATAALHTFWALDLDAPSLAWRELDPWPGPPRMLAIAGVQGGAFYLFSGTSLAPGPDGKPLRTYLQDAYRYTPGQGWQKLADLPRPAVAAPSPAIPGPTGTLLIPTGDDGLNTTFTPIQQHPGFPKNLLAYDPATDRWTDAGPIPFSRATVPVTEWQGRYIIPNGEVRPRLRTPEVWSAKLP